MESDQTIEENGRKSDVLYAAASVTPNAPETDNDIYYDTDTRKLNVRMGHILSKLTVNIRYGTEMTQNGATPSLTSVTLGETQTGYTMDLTSGSVGATGGKSEISMMLSDAAVEGYSKSAEAILVPQSAAFTITVIVDERTFVYNNAAFEFKKGNAYTLNLLVGKDITNIENISASEWTTDDILLVRLGPPAVLCIRQLAHLVQMPAAAGGFPLSADVAACGRAACNGCHRRGIAPLLRTAFRIKESFLPQGLHESLRPGAFQGIRELRRKRRAVYCF